MSGAGVPVARERRHTLYFLREIRAFAPVFLDTEVDMTSVLAHRAATRAGGRPYSVVSYVLHGAARVLADHPEANAAARGKAVPRVRRYASVHGKLTLDKTLGGRRVVLSAVLPDLDRASLAEIQRQVWHYADGDPAQLPEFAPLARLHRLPKALGAFAFGRAVRPLGNRARRFGTFAVTSLGHRAVDGFHSVGGTTVTLGVGRIVERPVVRDGEIVIAPILRLNLAFDHRVIDGAEAADVLTEIKRALEEFAAPGPVVAASAAVSAAVSASAAEAEAGAATEAKAETEAAHPEARPDPTPTPTRAPTPEGSRR
ncbi:2-oxo acid dehydrogenase subunit E2 [Embleya sp. AB8]|uniref:2-oxo acid dehydrogenase subunit E2 n=1 Tax=Embleya sp. AB8 TaxID=3156304 RepID=UPI003C7313A7